MVTIILDIETVPRTSIDEVVEEAVSKKVKAFIERTGDDPENTELLRSFYLTFFGQVLCIGMRWIQDDGNSIDKVVCEKNEEFTLFLTEKINSKILKNKRIECLSMLWVKKVSFLVRNSDL